MEQNFDNTKITVEFDEAGNRQQLSSGDSLKTLFGKIKKWFSDLKPIAFSGSYNDLSDKPETTEVPKGFDHRDNDLAWGTQEGEYITAWNAGDNCSVGFRKNCPIDGKSSMILDGTVYVDEGKYPVVNHNEYDKFNQVIRVGTMSGNAESCKNNPWYKVAELETNVAADDNNMTLLISTEFQGSYRYWGVIRITTRTSLEKKFEQGSIEWAFTNKRTSSYNDNKWLLLHNNDNPCKCEVWTKLSGRWENISVRLLSSSGTFDFVSKWKLINHNLNDLKTGSSSYTEGMDVIDATYGNFLVGNICYDGSKCVHPMIKFIDNQIDEYGNGIAIGGGGATIIGGGESSNVMVEHLNDDYDNGLMHGGDEKMIIANDGKIDFYTDCQQGYEKSGHVEMFSGNVKANRFIGVADSASKLQTPRKISLGGNFVGSANFDGSGDITITARNEYCIHTVNNTNNYPYHRFAYTEAPVTGDYKDCGDVFMIVKGFGSKTTGGIGIFQVYIRSEWTGHDSYMGIRWLVRDNCLPVDCIQGAINVTHNSTTVDLFYKNNNTYQGCNIFRISDFSRVGWSEKISLKMCNSAEENDTTVTDNKQSYECYKTLDDAETELGRNFSEIIVAESNSIVKESWFANKLCSEYIPKNSDLNTYVESGIYYNNLNAETKTLANCPTQNAFVMFVKQYGELDTGTQEITEYLVSNPKRYMRNFYNSTWGQWYRVYTTADPPTTTNVDWSNVQNKPTIPTAIRVKGNAESAYRTGDVNLTSDNIGALNKFGDTMNGNIIMAMNKGITFKNQSNDGIWFNNGSIATSSGTSYTSDMTIKTKYFYVYSDNAFFYNKKGTSKGNIYANLITSSSRRVKENIHNMTADEAIKILDINVVGFDYINGDKNQYGMIAEEVNEIIPNMVSGDVQCNDNDTEAIKHIGIDYSKAVPYLIKMVQMMDGEIKELKEKLKIRDKIDE